MWPLILTVSLTLLHQGFGEDPFADCRKNGVKYPYLMGGDGENCTESYLECNNGETVVKDCPPETEFDPYEVSQGNEPCAKKYPDSPSLYQCSYNCTENQFERVFIKETPFYGKCVRGVVVSQKKCPSIAGFPGIASDTGCTIICDTPGKHRVDEHSYIKCAAHDQWEMFQCPADFVFDEYRGQCVPPDEPTTTGGPATLTTAPVTRTSEPVTRRTTPRPCIPCYWWYCPPCK